MVVRQTLGWRTKTGEPLGRDWISHSQLRQKTGRSSESVSQAVDSLARQGLLTVEDERGRQLRSSASRKNRFDRLYFRLGPLIERAMETPYRETGYGKDGTTKDSLDKRNLYKEDENFGKAAHRNGKAGWVRAGDIRSTADLGPPGGEAT